MPGVRLVMTAADLPDPMPRFGPQLRDRPVLAVGETKFHGDPVAAVAAETLDAAEEAARLVRVDVEELPAVHTIAAARAPDAPLVQDPSLRPNDPLAGSNVLREHRYAWGDLEAAEREADVVVEGAYTFPMVTQFAIEPHGFMAAPNGDGIVVWSAIQHPNWLQRVIADLVRLPLSKVRIIAPDPGGGFGGKQHAKYEPLRCVHGATARPAGPPRPDPRGDVPGGSPGSGRDPRALRVQARRHARVPRHRRGLPDRGVCRHRGPDRRQGQLHVGRAVPLPGGPDRRPERAVAHGSVDGVPRVRQPAADLGDRIEHGRCGAGP